MLLGIFTGTMSLARPHHAENNQFTGDFRSSYQPNMYGSASTAYTSNSNRRYVNSNHRRSNNNPHEFSNEPRQQYNMYNYNVDPEVVPSYKRRKFSATNWESYGASYNQSSTYEYCPPNSKITFLPPVASDANAKAYTSTSYKRDRTRFEDVDSEFMSRDQIERFSPSRKDGIDAHQETHLRYSYCAFLQNLGVRLEL